MSNGNVRIIEWKTGGVEGENPLVYRLDDPEAAKACFRHLNDNAETDGREKLVIKEVTQAEWADIEKHSKEAEKNGGYAGSGCER